MATFWMYRKTPFPKTELLTKTNRNGEPLLRDYEPDDELMRAKIKVAGWGNLHREKI